MEQKLTANQIRQRALVQIDRGPAALPNDAGGGVHAVAGPIQALNGKEVPVGGATGSNHGFSKTRAQVPLDFLV